MNLSSLSRVCVSYDYENTLLSLNRGDEIQTKLTPTQDDVAVGIRAQVRSLLADDNEIRHASFINIGARSLNTYNNFILK